MSKTMGQIIKGLRMQKGITQEELAEIMYVTPQAISKWERDVGYPDIVQIVPLADAFGVSTDVLLNHEDGKQSEEIEQYEKRNAEFAHNGLIDERISLWREAIQKYPRSFVCLYNLADSIWSTLHRNKYSKEVTSTDNQGVDNYSFTSLCCKAIQEQQELIEQLLNKKVN